MNCLQIFYARNALKLSRNRVLCHGSVNVMCTQSGIKREEQQQQQQKCADMKIIFEEVDFMN